MATTPVATKEENAEQTLYYKEEGEPRLETTLPSTAQLVLLGIVNRRQLLREGGVE